ncbi:MAG: tRNA lysidine(34) synthetase TilS [Oscillospiraceae bacterium]|nr:tRNA lysidine(34) synthetase TilS [Oscillospiraceae bacterium]
MTAATDARTVAQATIAAHDLFAANARVYVGVSGGADSLCLLHILRALAFDVQAVHVNHQLRGETADADEDLVRKTCARWAVPLTVRRVDVAARAQKSGLGLEECGRTVRYEVFADVAQKGIVATAHTLSDRCETLLLNLARGSSLRGLGSIPYKRGHIVRPLLDVTRAQVEAYCAAQGIAYATDASNADVRYARNRVRHNVLPELQKINPQLEESLHRLFGQVAADESYLDETAATLLEGARMPDATLRAQALQSAARPVRTRALRLLLAELCVPITQEAVARLESVLGGGRVSVGGGVLAEVRRGVLTFRKEQRTVRTGGKNGQASAEDRGQKTEGRIAPKDLPTDFGDRRV